MGDKRRQGSARGHREGLIGGQVRGERPGEGAQRDLGERGSWGIKVTLETTTTIDDYLTRDTGRRATVFKDLNQIENVK